MAKKWYNTELSKEEYKQFRDFLVKNKYNFHPSECYNLVHVEIEAEENDVEKINNMIDKITELQTKSNNYRNISVESEVEK